MEPELSAELLDSVHEAIGRGVKVELKVRVQLEVKDRVEPRVLVLAPHRLLLLSTRVPTKVEQSLSLLDLQGISSSSPSQLVLEHDRGSWLLRSGTVSEVDDIIAHIGLCLQRICPGAAPQKLLKKLSLKPPERTAPLLERWGNSKPELGPCGGFSHQYWCVCDHLGLPYRDEVQWDVDTIYLTQDSRELNLQDFIHLDNRDLVPIVAALELNPWFTKLSVKDHKLTTEVSEALLRVVARSSRLEELLLDNTGLRSDFAQKLAAALSQNPASALHSLTLCNNSLEDKGMAALAAQLAKLPLGLKRLNLCRTGLSPKGANSLSHALSSNPAISSSLRELNLSANSLRGDDLQLHSFLMEPNHLETLDLSHSDCSLDQVCSSLLRGSVPHLSVLNMSKCVFSHRKCKEIPSGFKQFFSSAQSLTLVSVSGTKLPLDALKALLLGLGCNPNLSDVSLDLSSCDLRSAGAQVLEGCIAEIPNISSLDISDNGLDMDLLTLLVWLSKNRSIRHLALGKNFSNIKSKNLSQVLDNLVLLIQEEDSPLTSLSLSDSRLKSDLSILLNALGSNSSLTRLDISGNGMGDLGAKILAKALQINTKLRTIVWDRNSVSPQGLQDVAAALEKNYTIRFMPVPIVDAAQALKTNPEKTEDALLKMEQYLLRNHETRKYLQEQAYRLQQGIVMTTTQQMMDTMCVKVQDHLNSLKFSESPTVLEDVRRAQNLIMDARNSKTLLPSLYHLQNSTSRRPCVGAIQDTLESMAGEVSRVMEQQLQVLLELMVQSARSLCPHVMQRSSLRDELLQRGAKKMSVPQSFICTTLLQQSGADILNKISEVKLSLASFLSDRIVDEILESLSKSQLTLSEHVSRKGRPLEHDSETEVLDEQELRQATELSQQVDKKEQEVALTPSCPDASAMTRSKRKSILVRMLRPVSVAFETEFDLDKALEEVPIHVEDPPPLFPAASPLDGPSTCNLEAPPPELPSVQVQTLSHQTKSRPRPKKRTKPTRSKRVAAPPAVSAESQHESGMEKLDEGIDEFFSKAISRLTFKRPVPAVRSGSVEVEKKRESRSSGFFNYIKSRTSRSEKSHGTVAIIPPASSAAVNTGGVNHSATAPPAVLKEELSPVSPTPQPHDTLQPQAPTQQVQSEASTSETGPETGPGTRPESRPESGPESGAETGPETGLETGPESGSKSGAEKKPAALPLGPRHMGVPVLGAGLMAEMKAKLAAQKLEPKVQVLDPSAEGPTEAGLRSVTSLHCPNPSPDPSPDTSPDPSPDLSPDPSPDLSPDPSPEPAPSQDKALSHEESRPEPAPRSKPRTSTSTGPKSPISPSVSLQECEAPPSDAAPLPAPRLKRAPSHQDRDGGVCESPVSPANSECVGDAFESPLDLGNPGSGLRPWSSLKRSQSPDSEREERERATSLPDYVLSSADPGSVEEQAPEAEGGGAND